MTCIPGVYVTVHSGMRAHTITSAGYRPGYAGRAWVFTDTDILSRNGTTQSPRHTKAFPPFHFTAEMQISRPTRLVTSY